MLIDSCGRRSDERPCLQSYCDKCTKLSQVKTIWQIEDKKGRWRPGTWLWHGNTAVLCHGQHPTSRPGHGDDGRDPTWQPGHGDDGLDPTSRLGHSFTAGTQWWQPRHGYDGRDLTSWPGHGDDGRNTAGTQQHGQDTDSWWWRPGSDETRQDPDGTRWFTKSPPGGTPQVQGEPPLP